MIDCLGAACDSGLALPSFESPDDLSSTFAPCVAAVSWIECRADAGTAFGVCPDQPIVWQARCQSVYDRARAFNGQLQLGMVTVCPESLASSKADVASSQL